MSTNITTAPAKEFTVNEAAWNQLEGRRREPPSQIQINGADGSVRTIVRVQHRELVGVNTLAANVTLAGTSLGQSNENAQVIIRLVR